MGMISHAVGVVQPHKSFASTSGAFPGLRLTQMANAPRTEVKGNLKAMNGAQVTLVATTAVAKQHAISMHKRTVAKVGSLIWKVKFSVEAR